MKEYYLVTSDFSVFERICSTKEGGLTDGLYEIYIRQREVDSQFSRLNHGQLITFKEGQYKLKTDHYKSKRIGTKEDLLLAYPELI